MYSKDRAENRKKAQMTKREKIEELMKSLDMDVEEITNKNSCNDPVHVLNLKSKNKSKKHGDNNKTVTLDETMNRLSKDISNYNISKVFLKIKKDQSFSGEELANYIFSECLENTPFLSAEELFKEMQSHFFEMEQDFSKKIPNVSAYNSDKNFYNEVCDYVSNICYSDNVSKLIDNHKNSLHGIDKEEADIDVDSKVNLYVFSNRMLAYISITPPYGQGKKVTVGDVFSTILSSGVHTDKGLEFYQKIVEEENYLHFYKIAEGKLPVNGIDGCVFPCFSTTENNLLNETKDGKTDYRNLGKFHSVTANETLCNIVPPTKGSDGYNVDGKPLPHHHGNMPKLPAGIGTYITEDGLELRASTDGYMTYKNGVMNVKNSMIIDGDLDVSTGNILFNGHLEIRGDVKPGFVINVTGDVKIHGVVESSNIFSKGNIYINRGIKGNGVAEIYAGGIITSRFFENCKTVKAGNGIYADSIIHSDIYSDNSINVQTGQGAIIGGNIHAKNSVVAKTIGSESNSITNITLGQSFATEKRLEHLEKLIKTNKDDYNTLCKNISYLQSLPEIPKDQLITYNIWKKEVNIAKVRLMDNITEYAKLTSDKPDLAQCSLQVDSLHPIIKLEIGLDVKYFRTNEKGVYYKYDLEKEAIRIASK